ncbi:citrate/2-methylcitrate synthase [Actinoplanes sp. URMC 104]|uniref:citrate/2-methylcitrate synthase n=1 Tax=Actinoplanes sp. URMC 104 TaxID=3423409 RepID=UPI003F1E2F08
MPARQPPLLTTAEVAHLLGVKPATVYAYVSRGLLGSRRNADGKNSLFDRREVDAFLAARKRPSTPGIQTAITLIRAGALYYRGHDAVQLARVASFEEVATLLWTGSRDYVDLTPDPELRRLAEAVIAPLPHAARHTDRLRVIVAAAAAGDPLRFDTSPTAVIATGRSLLGTMVAALPRARRPAESDEVVSRRAATRKAGAIGGESPAGPKAGGREAGGEVAMADAAGAGVRDARMEAGAARTTSTGGADAADVDAADVNAADVDAADVDALAAGTKTAATKTAGTKTAGTKAAGTEAAGTKAAEVWAEEAAAGRREDERRIAEVLWERLTPREAAPRDHNLLDAALILLADHDMAASTLAARVAASTRAHPYAVVGAGLAALDGPLHGAASSMAYPLLAAALDRPDPVGAIAERLRAGEAVPGFGHRLYPDGDPRAVALLDMLGDTRAREAAERLAEVMRARSGVHPNVDLALAAITLEHGMPPDAGETIFAVARTAGWLAHALEEYADRPSRFRPTGEYAGHGPA